MPWNLKCVKYERFMISCVKIWTLCNSYIQFTVFLLLTSSPIPGMDSGIRCHEMKRNPTGYLWSAYESPLVKDSQDIDFYNTISQESHY